MFILIFKDVKLVKETDLDKLQEPKSHCKFEVLEM